MSKKADKTARFAAIQTLIRLFQTDQPVKPIFETVSRDCSLPPVERGLAMAMIFGVLRHRQYLDSLLQKLCKKPLQKLDISVHAALQVGVYQIFCLDRIPVSAAVNETVKALKAMAHQRHLHGFVNGVLRESVRQRENLPPLDILAHSSQPALNHPRWMTDRWRDHFGDQEMERICRVNNDEPRLVLRTNTSRIDTIQLIDHFQNHSIVAVPGSYAPDSLVLPDYQGAIPDLPGYQEGYFHIQDEAAQLAVLLLGPFTAAKNYLDGCAGLGGKTSHILQLSHLHDSRLVAVEPQPGRQRLLTKNLGRLFDTRSPEIHSKSLQEFAGGCNEKFSAILIDAPCSGTGVTGRHPDIRWHRKEEDLQRYHTMQLDILSHAAGLVSPGGVLVYATCSLEPEENQEVMNSFLVDHGRFSLADCSPFLPEKAHEFVVDKVFCPRPHPTIDGFFAARLEHHSS